LWAEEHFEFDKKKLLKWTFSTPQKVFLVNLFFKHAPLKLFRSERVSEWKCTNVWIIAKINITIDDMWEINLWELLMRLSVCKSSLRKCFN
jgi:hypothetical protein